MTKLTVRNELKVYMEQTLQRLEEIEKQKEEKFQPGEFSGEKEDIMVESIASNDDEKETTPVKEPTMNNVPLRKRKKLVQENVMLCIQSSIYYHPFFSRQLNYEIEMSEPDMCYCLG